MISLAVIFIKEYHDLLISYFKISKILVIFQIFFGLALTLPIGWKLMEKIIFQTLSFISFNFFKYLVLIGNWYLAQLVYV